MKVGTLLLGRSCRAPEKGPFKFVELLPLQLKNKVSAKSDKSQGVTCIQEMAVMFACMKAKDFIESSCSKEIIAFEKCYNTQLKLAKERAEQEALGKDAHGERNLSHRQLNRLLLKYPQYNEPKYKLVVK